MAEWNPEVYLKYGAQRLRPALDLIEKIPNQNFEQIVDLGCGPGTVTSILKDKWSESHVSGIDNSQEMLEKAKKTRADIHWDLQNISIWKTDKSYDLIFSNAAFHWLDDHQNFFLSLIDRLNDQGLFAVQMPNNFDQPTHQAIRDALDNPIWNGCYDHLKPGYPVSDPQFYYDFLIKKCRKVDIWQTTYLHELEGDNPVFEWTKGSVMGTVSSQIEDIDHQKMIEANYAKRLLKKYPKRANGKTLLPFKRLFILAQK